MALDNVTQVSAVHCSKSVQCTTVQYSRVQCSAVKCSVLQYSVNLTGSKVTFKAWHRLAAMDCSNLGSPDTEKPRFPEAQRPQSLVLGHFT